MSNYTDEFDAPASSTGVTWEELNGRLIVAMPSAVEHGISTVHGETDAVRARIVVCDGPDAGTVYDDVLVFPRVLQSQLRPKIGRKVAGRVGQGVAKRGQSAPWTLDDANPDERRVASEVLRGVPSNPVDEFDSPQATRPF